MFADNAIDTFDALLRKNIYGFKRRIFNINNDLISKICVLRLGCNVSVLCSPNKHALSLMYFGNLTLWPLAGFYIM